MIADILMVRVTIVCETDGCQQKGHVLNMVPEPMTLDEAEEFIDHWPDIYVPQDYCPKCGRLGTPGITDDEEGEQ